MPTGLIAPARETLPPDLYRQPAYVIVRPLWSLLGRVYRVYTTVYGRVWIYSGSLVGARGTVFSVDDAGRRGYRE